MQKLIVTLTFFLISNLTFGQSANLQGYVFDQEHEDRLASVNINIYQNDKLILGGNKTDIKGNFNLNLPAAGKYQMEITRPAYQSMTTVVDVKRGENGTMALPMTHLPDFEFTGMLKRFVKEGESLGEGVNDTRIEIYNKTTDKEELTKMVNPASNFVFHFERENKYIVLIRKEDFFAKRFDVIVDQDGCTICFEGLEMKRLSGIFDNHEPTELSASITGDIPLRPIKMNEIIEIENIYYQFNKANIKPSAEPALDNLVKVMRTTPIIIELSSHTDSRGDDAYNMTLSQERAESAVEYIVSKGIDRNRITAKGYGESRLVNECSNGVTCSDEKHQANRRTEFRVTDMIEDNLYFNKSLKEIIKLEKQSDEKAKKILKMN